MEVPAVSTKVKVKHASPYDKYFDNGQESRSGPTSELSTWMDSILLKEVILVLLFFICLGVLQLYFFMFHQTSLVLCCILLYCQKIRIAYIIFA